jgi:Na+-translocating ferredoxin:NAD+ oxidoreductase RnfD subunit
MVTGVERAPVVAGPAVPMRGNRGSVTVRPICMHRVELPSLRDPRLHVACVLVTLQVLGQTVLDFDLSIAQILVSVLTCAVLEVAITFRRRHVLAWPASAMLTGNGVALILRVPGTEHGDWWSLDGWWIYAGTAAVSILSKYLIRVHGRHVFNPSNFGLLACFLLLGPARVEPLDFWWVPMGPALVVTLGVIVVGGLVITWRLGLLGAAVGFWTVFAVCMAVLAAAGHCITATWHLGPVCGDLFWTTLVTSPEILVFLFFMITDPKTAPEGRVARVVYGVAVGLAVSLLVAPQRTEYAAKVAVLGGLAVVCAVRPFVERLFPAPGSPGDDLWAWFAALLLRGRAAARRSALVAGGIAAAGALLVVAGSPARSSASVDHHSLAGRSVDVDPRDVPPTQVDGSVRTIDRVIDGEQARRLARDVVADLIVRGDTLERRERELAVTGFAGPLLEELERTVRRARRTGRVSVPRYDLAAITILVVRSDSQALPQLGVTLRGREHRTTYAGVQPPRVERETTRRFQRTFSLLEVDGHFLVFDEARPE